MVSDPIGDFIIRLKNAGRAGHETVSVPYSKLRAAIAEKLQASGYLTAIEVSGEGVKKTLSVKLAYTDAGVSSINGVSRVSKPGRRVYSKAHEIFPVKFGRGEVILSTPAGILTGEEARTKHVGGEKLFIIW